MRVMILGGNFVGRGAEAMMFVVATELRKRIPSLGFAVMGGVQSLPPRASEFIRRYDVTYVPLGPRTVMDYVAVPLSRPLGLSYRYFVQYRRCVEQCVAIADIRGFTFIPDLGPRGANGIGYYLMAKIASNLGVKHIILPQVMGPINGRMIRLLARGSLRMAESITVRDEVTKRIVDSLSIDGTKRVDVCPDIAFLFEPAPDSAASKILDPLGLKDQTFVAVTPNLRVYERSRRADGKNEYAGAVAETVNFIRQQLEAQVVVIPHEVRSAGLDDSWVIERIMDCLPDREGVFALGSELSAAEVKAVIGRARVVVGSRYHSLIASLSMKVPCIATSWSHKYETLMNAVGMGEYCLKGTSLGSAKICDKLLRLWDERDTVAERIGERVAEFRPQVENLFDETAAIIEQAAAEQN